MSAVPGPWPGTEHEREALLRALAHHCTCAALRRRCPPHELLYEAQRLERLVYARRLGPRLWIEERRGVEDET